VRVAVRVSSEAAAVSGSNASAVQCDPAARRVWIEHTQDPGVRTHTPPKPASRTALDKTSSKSSMVFSSTFDCVSAEPSLVPLYEASIHPVVAHALSSGKRGAAALLLFGSAFDAHESLFGPSAPDTPSSTPAKEREPGGSHRAPGTNPGIASLAIAQALAALESAPEALKPTLELSAVELHCEAETDLLASFGGNISGGKTVGPRAVSIANAEDARIALSHALATSTALGNSLQLAHVVLTLRTVGSKPVLRRRISRGSSGSATAQAADEALTNRSNRSDGSSSGGGGGGGGILEVGNNDGGGEDLNSVEAGATLVLVRLGEGLPPGHLLESGGYQADVGRAELWRKFATLSRTTAVGGGASRARSPSVKGNNTVAPPLPSLLVRALAGVLDRPANAPTPNSCSNSTGNSARESSNSARESIRPRMAAICHLRTGNPSGGEKTALALLQQAQFLARVSFKVARNLDDEASSLALQTLLAQRRVQVGDAQSLQVAIAQRAAELEEARTELSERTRNLQAELDELKSEQARLHSELKSKTPTQLDPTHGPITAQPITALPISISASSHALKSEQPGGRRGRQRMMAVSLSPTSLQAGSAPPWAKEISGGGDELGSQKGTQAGTQKGAHAAPDAKVETIPDGGTFMNSMGASRHATGAPKHSEVNVAGDFPGANLQDYRQEVEMAWQAVASARLQKEELQRLAEEKVATQAYMSESRQAAGAALQAVGDNLHLLGWERRNSGQPELALPLYAAALAIYESVLGPCHPQAASTIVNLGNALFDLGRHAEAAELYRRSLTIDEEALGDDHPDVAMDLSNLGIVYRNMGHTLQAIALFERAFELLARALGEEHPSTLTVARNLSKLLALPESQNDTRDDSRDDFRNEFSAFSARGYDSRGLTPRELAEEVTMALDEETYVQAEVPDKVVGAHLLREHVAEARAAAGSQAESTRY